MTTGWLHAVLLAGVVVSTPSVSERVPAVLQDRGGAAIAVATHDFHVSYTRMAIEGSAISAQIRMFGDDITKALIARSKAPSLTLNSPQGEAAAQAYLAEAFPIVVNGRKLVPVVASATQERDMWSYIVTWQSPVPITTITMHNAAMMEYFADQQNIVKLKHISSGKEATLFYSGGSRADQAVKF